MNPLQLIKVEKKSLPQIVGGIHPDLDLPDKSSNNCSFCLLFVTVRQSHARSTLLSFQLECQDVDGRRKMLQCHLGVIVAQLSKI